MTVRWSPGAIRLTLILIPLLLIACGSGRAVRDSAATTSASAEPSASRPVVVDGTAANALVRSSQPIDPTFDIGVVVFAVDETGLDDDVRALRSVEAQWMAQRLRQSLVESGAWGAVRVLPSASPVVPLLVTGELLASDGESISVRLEARDSRGRVWLANRYLARAPDGVYPVAPGADPFDHLWRTVANALLSEGRALPDGELEDLVTISRLRHAQSLVPEAFSGFLDDTDGLLNVQRLPATDDPMWQRLARIRDFEFAFVDTVDEQIVAMSEEVAPVYNAWREATKAQATWLSEYEARVDTRERSGSSGSFSRLYSAYLMYRSVRIQQQDLYDFARGFANETTPMALGLENRLIRLEGSLQDRYRQWRQLLADIYRLEQGT